MDDVRRDVLERLTGSHQDAIAEVVWHLHVPPCPNTNQAVSFMFMSEITPFGMSLGLFKTAQWMVCCYC